MSRPSEELLAQYDTARRRAAVVPIGRTSVRLTGTDRASFLHNMCTNDIKRLQPGTGCEAFLTTVQGKVLAFVTVLCDADSLTLDSSPRQSEIIINQLDRYLIREDVKLEDRSGDAHFFVAGEELVKRLNSLGASSLPVERLQNAEVEIAGHAATIWQAGLGVHAHFIRCSSDVGRAVAESLADGGIERVSEAVFEILRLEAAWPEFGRDITNDQLAQEIGRDAEAISFTKGCYLGQETVARIDALGHVNRQLVSVAFAGDSLPEHGCELRVSDKGVGSVTSSAWSPQLGRPLALAYVRRGHHEVGTILDSPHGSAQIVVDRSAIKRP